MWCSCHVLEVYSKDELSSVKDHALIQKLNEAYIAATSDNQPRQGQNNTHQCNAKSTGLVDGRIDSDYLYTV